MKEYGVGKYTSSGHHPHNQQTIWRDSAFYQSYSFSTDNKISFLDNIVEVFETEVDDNAGNVIEKVWEWK